jgi:membrane protease YdiL (CAAX protease family)
MKNVFKKVSFLSVAVLMSVSSTVFAQTDASGLKTSFNNVWAYVQLALVFVIVLTFVIGGITVYNKKSSGNPDEFKKALMGFIYGIIFLFVMLGFITVIKGFATTNTSVNF